MGGGGSREATGCFEECDGGGGGQVLSAWIGGRSRGRQLPKVSAAKGALNRREARIVFFFSPKK